MSADIQITTTLPAAHEIGRRLNSAALKVMHNYAKVYRADWINRWQGWEYKDRPKKAPRLVSQRAWRAKAIPNDTGATLEITNAARDWRKKKRSYVAYVHRAGRPKADVEWLRVREVQAEEIDKAFFRALAEAMAKGAGPKSRRKVGPTGVGAIAEDVGLVL